MKFKDYLNEATDKVIYVKESGELWVTYSQSSGQTAQLQDITKFLSDITGDKSYDGLVPKLSKFAKNTKPLKANKDKTVKMFEVPIYSLSGNGSYDIWGGDIKPQGKMFMIVTEEKNTIVNFFKSKNEALAWMRGTV